ncbi:ATP-binding protein [Zoogloea sp.]|uniref:sensor histidine kinase n=1 Tax=Zoogloea sp. TaxID=49181 RepID=UPI0025FA40AA|nr:ATP-binding protein [Zoogloea sp.]MCK6395556.1 ATP-binding protein [Zoogloea sp.]
MERLPLSSSILPTSRTGAPEAAQVPHNSSSLRRFRFAVWLAFALLASLIVGVALSLIRFDREQALQRAESELLSLTRVLEEHVARSFGETESAISEIAGQIAQRGSLDAFGERELQILLRQRTNTLPEADFLFVEREDGSLAADSSRPAEGAPPAENGTGRKHAMPPQLRDGVEIGSPTRSPASGQWVTPLSRQIFDPLGKYLGTAGAAMSHGYFEGVYRELGLSPQDTILILHASRAITLIRYPQADGQIGTSVADSPAIGADLQQRSMIVTASTAADPIERITAYRRLADLPLIVATSRPVDSALIDYYEHRDRILAAAGVMLALLGALAILLHRDTVRRDGERAALAELNATLEQRVLQRTEELEHSNRELLSFSYSVSHDLRAPLRAINGFSHALAEDYGDRLDETGQSYLIRLRRASLRMGELIDELQKLASVSRHTLRIEHTDVSAIAHELLDELAATSPGRVVQSHVDTDLSADADPVLIRNALQNLLANAWKFTRDSQPALIHVGGRPHGDEKLFYVTDNGIGFDMAHAAKLFQPFQQLHRRDGFEGSGIGLASVRRVIERHGGAVWAESSPGTGTTMYFTLPRSPAMVRRPREKLNT